MWTYFFILFYLFLFVWRFTDFSQARGENRELRTDLKKFSNNGIWAHNNLLLVNAYFPNSLAQALELLGIIVIYIYFFIKSHFKLFCYYPGPFLFIYYHVWIINVFFFNWFTRVATKRIEWSWKKILGNCGTL